MGKRRVSRLPRFSTRLGSATVGTQATNQQRESRVIAGNELGKLKRHLKSVAILYSSSVAGRRGDFAARSEFHQHQSAGNQAVPAQPN